MRDYVETGLGQQCAGGAGRIGLGGAFRVVLEDNSVGSEVAEPRILEDRPLSPFDVDNEGCKIAPGPFKDRGKRRGLYCDGSLDVGLA